ncbi:MAG: DUF885 family protein [Maricaulaceae bacterium]
MGTWRTLMATAAASALAAACGEPVQTPEATATPPTATPAESTAEAATDVEQTESERLYAWFEVKFQETLLRNPQFLTFLGRKERYDEWGDPSDAFAVESYELQQAAVDEMRAQFDFDQLNEAAKLSYRLFEYGGDQAKSTFPFRNHIYVFHQFRSPIDGVPSFLINQHRVGSLSDAEAYVTRLETVDDYLAGEVKRSADNFDALGVSAPDWSFPQMIATARNVISGAPFDDGDPSPIWADAQNKIKSLDIEAAEKTALLARAETALLNDLKPAYEAIIVELERQAEGAIEGDGVWRLPDGAAYYQSRLNSFTTTKLTADEIHDLGLSEVERIHAEMRAIMQTVGFEGDLQAFFAFMREDEQFYYPNTDEGRDRYLREATALIDTMRDELDAAFGIKPQADMIVKRVEPFRERSAGKAFYQRPAPDGSRPGTYYANLYDMKAMPTYQMEALAYHEGIPGHHMQIAVAQELPAVPSFRRFGGYTAYSEGWGLYTEFLPKEMGFYEDPYSDFGRLAMELWRAARLVVDTGLHHKQWTRETAIDYLVENTPNPAYDAEKAIERYIVMPGQATAYKIGMLEILRLREAAKSELGDAFDIRGFHDAVLGSGAVPLAILGENIDAWVASVKATGG